VGVEDHTVVLYLGLAQGGVVPDATQGHIQFMYVPLMAPEKKGDALALLKEGLNVKDKVWLVVTCGY
jgi:hypothetical protein